MQYTWKTLRRLAVAVATRWRVRMTRIRVAPLSAEWLRGHENDANKHGRAV